MKFNQSEIVVIPFPFSDLSSIKQRPVLVLSNNSYNNSNQDLVVCGITSNLKDSKYSTIIENNNLTEGKIPKKSRIKADKIFTLKQSLVKKKVCTINNKIFEKVISKIIKLVSN